MDRTFEEIKKLGAAVRTHWGRADRLDRHNAEKSQAIEDAHEAGLTARRQEHAAGVAAAVAARDQELARLQENHQRRKAVIERGLRTSQLQMRRKVKAWEGNQKYRLQMERMRLEREHPTNLAAIDQRFTEYERHKEELDERIDEQLVRARRSFRGYERLLRQGWEARTCPTANAEGDEFRIVAGVEACLDEVERALNRFEHFPSSRLFRILPPQVLVGSLLGAAGIAVGLFRFLGEPWQHDLTALGLAGVGLLLVGGAWIWGRRQAKPATALVGGCLGAAEKLLEVGLEKAAQRRHNERARAEKEFQEANAALDEEWRSLEADAAARRAAVPTAVAEKAERALRTHDLQLAQRTARAEAKQAERVRQLDAVLRDAEQASEAQRQQATQARETRYLEEWRQLEDRWGVEVVTAFQSLEQRARELAALDLKWDDPAWEKWTAPNEAAERVQIGRLEVDISRLAAGVEPHPRLPFPGATQFELPVVLALPQAASLLFETQGPARGPVQDALNQTILRLLTAMPPGKIDFTLLDPVELGQNFAGIMHLADFEDSLVNKRIWTEPRQIEQRLAELNEHMEKVIQMYLRNDYRDLAEYNRQAGEIAEKYHFLVIADFPAGFSELALRRLTKIAASGARCGVFTLIHWDTRKPLPAGISSEELRRESIILKAAEAIGLTFEEGRIDGIELRIDPPPDPEAMNAILRKIGESHRGATRVEVPFAQIAPEASALWSRTAVREVRVPIGRTGATKLQELALGLDTRQHALIVGKTGSGKSNLFHVIVTNLALWSSPDEVEFYLVDFKKGVEFKCYATQRLPHARVVAVESEREFGLSVLQRIDQELDRRGDLFRAMGVQDLPGYNAAGGEPRLPRTLLIVDEFQEFFVEDDRIAQNAALLLDRLVRQGRAFGVHVVLGSQTLGGAYTLARTTLGQMVVRIALQCNEADAFLIMDENNMAPRLLSRPGEAIYNDAAGQLEGNSPFQVVWLPESEREKRLGAIRERADAEGMGELEPVVFEGNAPADIRENRELAACLAAPPKRLGPQRVWLGAPNAIKGPIQAVFQRQSGSHLLIAGQRDESVRDLFATALVALAAQTSVEEARFVVLDPQKSDAQGPVHMACEAIPHPVEWVDVPGLDRGMDALGRELDRRLGEPAGAQEAWPNVFTLILGLQKWKRLKYEEDFGFGADAAEDKPDPGTILNRMLTEGPSVGMYVLCACDNFNSFNRILGRKALQDLGMRVLFQMSANDSVSLIDSPAAAQLGLHKALFYSEQEGRLEAFRPYARPGREWFDAVSESLGAGEEGSPSTPPSSMK